MTSPSDKTDFNGACSMMDVSAESVEADALKILHLLSGKEIKEISLILTNVILSINEDIGENIGKEGQTGFLDFILDPILNTLSKIGVVQ